MKIEPLRIGPIQIDPPVLLAPMAGYTDHAFRLLCHEMGAGLVCTELISCHALAHGNKPTRAMLDWTDEERPVGCQVFGSSATVMATAAQIITSYHADLIDINMGCDVPKVLKTGAGAALLKDPKRAADVVASVSKATMLPVTVKIRGGWGDSPDPAPVGVALESAGASAITIHPRRAGQRFEGKADWSLIKRLKEAVRIPVIGCGDIHGPEDAERMLRETGCDAVMIGQAALGNPWIFRQVKHYFETGTHEALPTPDEQVDLAVRHVQLLCELKGEHTAVVQMRSHIQWYLRGLHGASRVREAMNNCHTLEAILAVLNSAHNYLTGPSQNTSLKSTN